MHISINHKQEWNDKILFSKFISISLKKKKKINNNKMKSFMLHGGITYDRHVHRQHHKIIQQIVIL